MLSKAVQQARIATILGIGVALLLLPSVPHPLEPPATPARVSALGELSPEDHWSDGAPSRRLPQTNDIRFERISLEHGLSQSAVQCILQDSRGFMWFGTQDGLNRYDGYEFVVYKNDPEDPNSLSGNWIQSLYEDQAGMLWIGTNGAGLNRFDPNTGQFTHYQNDSGDPHSLSDNDVQAVYEDRSGVLWVGTGAGGLNRLDRETNRFTHYSYNPDDHDSLSSNNIQAIYEDRSGVLWIGTFGGGLERFDRGTEQFTHHQHDPSDPHSLISDIVQAIFEDQSGALWVGTNGGGLERFDRETGEFRHHQNDPTATHSLSDDVVLALYGDQEGVLWIGTASGGLDRFDRETGQFIHYRNDPNDPHSLSNNQVQAIYEDRSGVLWIGTFGGGLSVFDPSTARFAHYRNDPSNPQTLVDDQVWSLCEDEEGAIWIGTAGGLDRFEREERQFTHFRNDPGDPQSLSVGTVTSLYADGEGMVWIGTWDGALGGGLDRLDPETAHFVHFDTPASFSITQDRDGVLWIGTMGGLGRYDQETGGFVYYQSDPNDPYSLSDNFVSTIYQDREGELWIGTLNGGLNRFDRETGRFARFQNVSNDPHSLSSNTVLSVYQDQEGTLWIGTTGGLNRLDRTEGIFTYYREDDGLPNDVVYGILEDDNGDLWMSTNGGLSRFDPRTETFKNYDVRDGLQSNEFNQGAYLRSSTGEMFFGGINGLTAFHPQDIIDNPYIPPIVLTSLTQGGEHIDASRAVDSITEVTFKWPNNFFEFEFAALSYAQSKQNQYAYFLEGFEEEWSYIGTRRFGRYTNIPGGTYTLRIKGSNNDDVWNQEGVGVRIAVVPPFWQTWWFRITIAVAAVGGPYAAFRLRLRVIETQRRQLATEVDARTRELRETLVQLERSKEAAEAANRAKSIFLANMSHELRTPLNAILGFTELMSHDPDLSTLQKENLAIINQSGEHLLSLINEVLELSKIEAGRMVLKERSFDLHHLLSGLEDMFRLRAEEKDLILFFDRHSDVPQYVWMDEGKLRQVLMNLLGNAVKFTETGSVTLRIASAAVDGSRAEGLRLAFEVEDTGPGIAPEELTAVFAPFEQTVAGQNSREGTGLGLPISRQYVRLMGGELTASSPLPSPSSAGGPGSLFRFDVPAALVDVSTIRRPRPARQVIGMEPDQPIYRLLIVEDNWANRRLLIQLLTPLGFELREAVNGQEALEIWDGWAPDLILMDMRMPVMDGYEATKRIKATAKGQNTIVIALTASALEEDRAAVLAEGCDGFVRKPFRQEELFDALAEHLGVRFVYQELPSVAPTRRRPPGDGLATASPREALAALPADLVTDLHGATLRADLDSIASVIDRIRTKDEALADSLADLAHSFDHDTILGLIQSLGEHHE